MPLNDVYGAVVGKLTDWTQAAVLMLPNLGAALLVAAVFWLLARISSGLVARLLHRLTPYQEINRLLSTLVWLVVLSAGLFIALGILQLEKTVTSLVAGAGILTLIVGLAFQDLATNFMAGILLQLRHPFRKGHLVSTNDFFGAVEHVNLRATVIRTLTGQVVIVPNKDVFQKPLVNYSTTGERRVDVQVGVSYGTDLERAQQVAARAVSGVPGRRDGRETEVFYEGFGDSSINFALRFWIAFEAERDYLLARSEAVKRIKQAFDEADITIPFPIRTLDFSEVGGRMLSEELRK
jgi:small conductance mechanosensitive channel